MLIPYSNYGEYSFIVLRTRYTNQTVVVVVDAVDTVGEAVLTYEYTTGSGTLKGNDGVDVVGVFTAYVGRPGGAQSGCWSTGSGS